MTDLVERIENNFRDFEDGKIKPFGYDHFLLKEAATHICILEDEIKKLKSALRKQIMIYQVDDQAWDRDADANRIMSRLLTEEKIK